MNGKEWMMKERVLRDSLDCETTRRSCEDGSEFVADSFASDEATVHDAVNHPAHYTSHPSGIEVIQITEHENFCVGNAIKYLLRAGKKGSKIEDLQKAGWYITREIERLENG